MGAWALRRTLWKYHKRSDSPVKNSRFIASMRSTNKGNYDVSTPCCHFPHNQRSHNRNLNCLFPAGSLEAQKKNLLKSEGENPGLILLLILAVDRQRLVRRLNDFHGRCAIYIRPKSISKSKLPFLALRSRLEGRLQVKWRVELGKPKKRESHRP